MRGIIPSKACKASLVCPKCNTKWRDPTNYTFCENVGHKFSYALNFHGDFFSKVHTLIFEEPCPKCGVMIQKDGGCPHMVCQKCRHEFCWLCLGAYYSYNHTEFRGCPIRKFNTVGFAMIFLLFINMKCVYIFEFLNWLEWLVFYNVGAFICIDVYIVTVLIHLAFKDFYKNLEN